MLQDKSAFIQVMEEGEYDNQYYVHETIRTLEAQQESQKPKEKTPEELVLEEYHKYLNVFSKMEPEQMLIRKPWDHAIDLKDTFKPKKGRITPLSPQEQEEVTAFLDDQLKKGYIRPSKFPQRLRCSLCLRKMARSIWYRTTDTSMSSLLKTITPCR